MENTINQTFFFPHPAEMVWDYLTKPELLEQWLMKTDIQPIVGHKFRFTSTQGMEHYCEMLEVKPFTKLSYSWRRNSAKDKQPFDSTVVWTLVPKENGTELQLAHGGFIAIEDYTQHHNGWAMLVKGLVERLNTIKNGNKTKNTIEHTFLFPHPAEMVWEYLTKPELISQWLMPSDIKPVIGHKFQFTTNPIPAMNFDGHIYCEVLEMIPFKKFSYSWKGGPEPGKINLDTVAVWTLTPKENGTVLHLEHTGFKEENAVAYDGMNIGWGKNMGKISNLISLTKNA